MGNPYGRGGVHASSIEDRIAQSVRQDGDCLVWVGSFTSSMKNAQGGEYRYGRIYFNGRQRFVHRIAWELKNGPIPKGHEVGRTCRNTLCIAQAHMFLFGADK